MKPVAGVVRLASCTAHERLLPVIIVVPLAIGVYFWDSLHHTNNHWVHRYTSSVVLQLPSDQVHVSSRAESEPPIQHWPGQSALTAAFSLA